MRDGIDIVSYAPADGAVTVSLERALRTIQEFDGWADGDSFVSIENLSGSDFGDILVGDMADNRIGGGGFDTIVSHMGTLRISDLTGTHGSETLVGNQYDNDLTGYKGADVLNGHGGNDSLSGGQGNDIYVFNGDRGAGSISETGGRKDFLRPKIAIWRICGL